MQITQIRKTLNSRLAIAGSKILTPAGIICCAVLIWLSIAGLCAGMLVVTYDDARTRAVQNASNLALMLEREILRSVAGYDLSLRAVTGGAANPRVMALPPDLRDLVLFDRSASAGYFGPISLLDSRGRQIANSAHYAMQRGTGPTLLWLAAHESNTDSGLYVSSPLQMVLAPDEAPRPVLALSRRIMRHDGSIVGAAIGRIDIAWFQSLLDGLAIGRDGSVSMLETDGTLIARLPGGPDMVGRSLARSPIFRAFLRGEEGSFAGTSTLDGMRRLYVYRHLPGLPIIVVVAPALAEVYASWSVRALLTLLSIVLVTMVFVLGVWTIIRELSRRTRAREKLLRLAQYDALTGLENRGTFELLIAREWARSVRHASPLSLLFIDIDNFKAYNDHYGHPAGDAVLKAVAQRIADCVSRATDRAARYGGEEFVVALPGTDEAGAIRVAERVCRAVFALAIAHVEAPPQRVTVSIGVACSHQADIASVADLVRCADTALYAAKSAGRNRVCAHAASAATPAESRDGGA